MKQVRILILIAVAATAFMATVGAGTASATLTSLCKKDTTVTGLPKCEGGHLWPAGTKIHAPLEAGAVFKLETGLGIVECSESTLEATTEKATETPLKAKVNAFTFGECQSGGELVEVFAVTGTLDIEIIDLPVWTHNGTLTFTGTKIEVFFEELGVECVYEAGHTGILKGGNFGTIEFNGTTWPKVAGVVLCGATGKVNAAYLASPEKLWVST